MRLAVEPTQILVDASVRQAVVPNSNTPRRRRASGRCANLKSCSPHPLSPHPLSPHLVTSYWFYDCIASLGRQVRAVQWRVVLQNLILGAAVRLAVEPTQIRNDASARQAVVPNSNTPRRRRASGRCANLESCFNVYSIGRCPCVVLVVGAFVHPAVYSTDC